jgi:hypothetical protein
MLPIEILYGLCNASDATQQQQQQSILSLSITIKTNPISRLFCETLPKTVGYVDPVEFDPKLSGFLCDIVV